ncbi:MAG: hypothetical protein IPN49_08635 [Saprospiraceae bacterium]|nr:hypothetical protein [Saprospiraceae bacterium]MBK6566057.1 hypothetical protein [Saprospiraceae bacterium]MBK6784330.1 hypothetical protein [Saprospiraceae bacterium]MBK7525769.1 hypothetical protein [Saprospiraceae bacterium]MBK8369925.1 hypothetical protein [Saprospiraceae bacterium]
MKFLFRKLLFLSVATLFIIHIQSCLKGEFDNPPAIQEPNISAENIVSLQEVLDKLVLGQAVKLDLDKYVKAVVIADDKSGNFYKTIHVKDENSALGIGISIEETEIHAHYPVGRRVFIHLKDLYIADNAGLPLLNYGTYNDDGRLRLQGIPGVLMQKVLLKGATGIVVEPVKTKISQLGNAALNTLIQLDDIEFRDASPTTTYAINNPLNPLTLNHTLVDCEQGQITLRNSGYATFAGAVVPRNNGSIIGIYTVFGNTKQIFIRDTTDVIFTNKRCGEREGNQISIRELRDNYENGINVIPAGTYLKGVVISDYTQGNIQNQNIVVQDGDAGIVCRFGSVPNTPLGTEVRVNLTGLSMSEFNGLLQVSNIPLGNLVIIGPGTLPQPKVLKINQLESNAHESTLIKIVDAEFKGGTTYGTQGVTIEDNSGSVQVFTRTQSTFSSAPIKTGKVKVTAIVGKFNTIQLQLRSLIDVE